MNLGAWFGWLAFVALTAVWPGQASAETRAHVCIARDGGVGSPAVMIVSLARFDCHRPQMSWGPGDYWAVTSALPGALGIRPTLVRTFSMWQGDVRLWALYADGRVLPVPFASGIASIGTAIEHAIPARGVAVTRLLWRVHGAQNLRGIVAGVRLVEVKDHARASVALAIDAGLMAGLCIAFMFFAAALWLALRQTFLLAYCAMVGGLLLYLLADAGLWHRLVPTRDRLFELRLSAFTFTLCVLGGLWFARTFLESRTLGRRGDRVVRVVALAVLVLSAVKEVLAPWAGVALDQMLGVALIAALGTVVFMAARTWTRASAFRWIWPATALVPAMLIAMRVANTFRLFAAPFAMGASILMVMATGMFVSTLAIAYRIHRLGRERDQAREQEIAARLLADTDPLTGLLNRRSFLTQAIGRPGAQTLLIADLDHFKKVNETIGHDGGDEVLCAFARALEAVAPPGALVARIGGEEFAVVVAADARLSPSGVLTALRTVRMPFDIAVTTSIGTCTGPLMREADWKTLYRQADSALYAAKDAGRDRARDAGALPLAA